jgi:hypothetical protein
MLPFPAEVAFTAAFRDNSLLRAVDATAAVKQFAKASSPLVAVLPIDWVTSGSLAPIGHAGLEFPSSIQIPRRSILFS